MRVLIVNCGDLSSDAGWPCGWYCPPGEVGWSEGEVGERKGEHLAELAGHFAMLGERFAQFLIT